MNWSNLLLVAALGGAAHADPARPLDTCTLAGSLPKGDAIFDGLVATPDGRLVVLAEDGTLHAFEIRAGAACALDVDRGFGRAGVVALGLGKEPVSGRLDVDARGTLYAMLDGKHVRVTGGRVSPMCGDGMLAASRGSARLWRWSSLDSARHESADCKTSTTANLSPSDRLFLGTLWAIGDRVVAEAGETLQLFDGERKVTLENPAGVNFLSRRFLACGTKICGAGASELAVWNSDGKRVARTDLDIDGDVRGFAVIGETAYLLVNDYKRGLVMRRVRGLPR